MKYTYRFLTILLLWTPIFIQAQSSSENSCSIPNTTQSSFSSYLSDLETLGYCVIPEVLSFLETEVLYKRVWHEFIEKAWPHCKMDDRSNWKEAFPIQNKFGIFAGPAGQTQVMWDLRQDPRIIEVFAQIWNTHDLIVSMDGLSLMCPPEIREGYIEPWPHVDQAILQKSGAATHSHHPPLGFVSESSLKTQPYTIQGQFLFEDSFEGDGGFYCIPQSHLHFSTFAPQLETIENMDISREDKNTLRKKILYELFCDNNTDDSYHMKHVTAPRGSLILWDSRTIHWNQHANPNRPTCTHPKVRMVSYLCYVPKTRLTEAGKKLRMEAFEKGVSTNCNPAFPVLKYTKDHIDKEFGSYLEDRSYTAPKIQLTLLGKSLLGDEL